MAIFVAVCEIFSVKEWRDIENQVRGRSRSLKLAPFDGPHTTFYWSAVVNIALSCTIFELFDVKLYRDLEIGARNQSRSLKLVRTDRQTDGQTELLYQYRASVC